MMPTEPRTATDIFNPSLVGSSGPMDWLRQQRLIYISLPTPQNVSLPFVLIWTVKLNRSQGKYQKEKALPVLL